MIFNYNALERWYQPPNKKNYKGKSVSFSLQCYNSWSFNEIKEHLHNTDKPLIDALEEFRSKMDDFACAAKTDDARLVFAAAYDVATDILDDQILRNELKRKAGKNEL